MTSYYLHHVLGKIHDPFFEEFIAGVQRDHHLRHRGLVESGFRGVVTFLFILHCKQGLPVTGVQNGGIKSCWISVIIRGLTAEGKEAECTCSNINKYKMQFEDSNSKVSQKRSVRQKNPLEDRPRIFKVIFVTAGSNANSNNYHI